MGGDVPRLSWRKCQKVAPSWSGFFGGAQCRAELDDALDLAWAGYTQAGKVSNKGVPYLAGPEHHLQPLLTHHQVLSLAIERAAGRRPPRVSVSGSDATLDA